MIDVDSGNDQSKVFSENDADGDEADVGKDRKGAGLLTGSTGTLGILSVILLLLLLLLMLVSVISTIGWSITVTGFGDADLKKILRHLRLFE